MKFIILFFILSISSISSSNERRKRMGGYTEVDFSKPDELLTEALYIGRNHILKELIDTSVTEFTIKNISGI
jgi:hypothetical protein